MASFRQLYDDSYLFNASYLEERHDDYLENKNLSTPFKEYFDQITKQGDVAHRIVREDFVKRTHPFQHDTQDQSSQVLRWIEAYRTYGHMQANLDPLGLASKRPLPDLDLAYYGIDTHDHLMVDLQGNLGIKTAPLATIVTKVRQIYSSTIGFEYKHLSDFQIRQWLQAHIECDRPLLDAQAKRYILQRLIQADGLEKYLGLKYVAQKRFSLEGGDTFLLILDHLITQAAQQDVREVVIGMAHRGRLNVLVNLLGKSPSQLFGEFEGIYTESDHSGDVKYHLGFSSDLSIQDRMIRVTVGFNPSHLESINPVIEGSVRARQESYGDDQRALVVPILVHGDASFSGQGIVMETLELSQTQGYGTGGTIHIVINNQVGFTTDPQQGRSSWYCTDAGKIIETPIFHVNGDDPEAVLWVTQLAWAYRMKFKRDVIIDLVCYRRHGHNEADEPAATQPLMYQAIKALPAVCQQYAKQLIQSNIFTAEQVDALSTDYRNLLDQGKSIVKNYREKKASHRWSIYRAQHWRTVVDTRVSLSVLRTLAQRLEKLPRSFTLQPQVAKLLEDRRKMTNETLPINWGYAEVLAYASLLREGYWVRISGQDCARGTFFHRHAVLHDYKTGQIDIPLSKIADHAQAFSIFDSTLSEAAVMGFEYGYASTHPNALVIWEAQYGDFVNGAQVIIDQFLSSSEQKWQRLCGLVLFLPHGYEGAGPEHTSARLERFLQLCAQENMQVCIPTTPAQIFHLLRRQMLRPYRKPLIVFTPKSLLRHKLATSSLKDLAQDQFKVIIPEIDPIDPRQIVKIIFCSGKIYYDLLAQRRNQKQIHVLIIRIEQLYPFPEQEIAEQLKQYQMVKEVIWCQEEPKNQGAWLSIAPYLQRGLSSEQHLRYVGRSASAAPAVGSSQWHLIQQRALVEEALGS